MTESTYLASQSPSELTRMTAAELADKIHSREVSSVEVTQAHLDRIDAVDSDLHAFLHVGAEAALEAASRVDAALVSRLQSRARLLRELLRAAGVGVAGLEQSAIIPVHVGDELLAVEAAAALQDRGIQAPAIRYPTVPRGQAILRLTVMATHSDEQVKECARVLAEIFENLGLTRPVE